MFNGVFTKLLGVVSAKFQKCVHAMMEWPVLHKSKHFMRFAHQTHFRIADFTLLLWHTNVLNQAACCFRLVSEQECTWLLLHVCNPYQEGEGENVLHRL